jgi:type I restriction enzyme S subunit
MSFPRYERYKDSGVEWLGEVPAGWEVKRVKRNFRLLSEKTGRREHLVALENIESWSGRFIETETEFQGDGVSFNAGDILFGKLRPYLAKALLADQSGEAVGDFHVLRPCSGVMGRFAIYQILNQDFISIVDGSTFGAKMPRVSWDFMANLHQAVPPLPEQHAIAAFLDCETAKIDALIAEQQRLVALLAEKRQAVISHAVTKGLNPAAPMKDSGVEWLGEVPVGWEVGPLKRFADVIDCKHYTVEFLDNGWPVVSIRELRDDKIDLSNAKLTSRAEWDFLREGRVPTHGDMIFCRNASVGAVGYVDSEDQFCMGQDVCLIRPVNPDRFIHYQLTSKLVKNQIEGLLVGATIRRANVEEIRGLIITNPPKNEQHVIAAFLDTETAKIDTLVAEAERAMTLLKERRTALISAGVTGKIDVRQVGQVGPV